jgi:hypothetical protein
MYSVHRGIQAASVFVVLLCMPCTITYSQSTRIPGHATAPLLATTLPAATAACAKETAGTLAASPASASASGDVPVCDAPSAAAPAIDPCSAPNQTLTGCEMRRDLVQADLDSTGKAGQKISRARARVLEILEIENACRAWFQQKDPNPAATFRTLRFALDRKGDEYVRKSRDLGSSILYHSPYVARVFQGDGRYATVTLNVNGAFFVPLAQVLEIPMGGGPSTMRGARPLHVGPYEGNTPRAQVLALLHEFGHVLDLLPQDEDNIDGKSMQNTEEVLRSCRAAVDSAPKRSLLLASR